MKKGLVTQKEICEYLGITAQTFAANRVGEKLRAYKVGKRVKYSLADVENLRIKTW